MITGPSVGPGMLLTVLMRWPALILIGTIGGVGYYGYKEYGLPESVELALGSKQMPEKISDSINHADVIDVAVKPATASAPIPAVSVPASPEPVVMPEPVVETKKKVSPRIGKYQVNEGDSLSKIAIRMSPNLATQKAMMEDIFNANPRAFRDEDPNQLRADVVLSIPPTK